MGALLLAIGRVLLWALALLLALVILLLVLPFTVKFCTQESETRAWLTFGPFRLSLWPLSPWLLRLAALLPQGEAPKRPAPAPTEPAAPKPKQPQKLRQAADTAAAAGQFVRRALWSLRIRHVRLVLPVYAPDAAACALACGKAQAELGAAFGLLQNFFRIEVEEFRIEPDFLDQRAEEFALSGQATARLLPLVIAGLHMVFRLADSRAE
mgnify:CR=1 FL=1